MDHELPFNPYENMNLWAALLTKGGRQTLKDAFTFPSQPAVKSEDLQKCRCCHELCDGLVARDGHCCKCGQKFAALIVCPCCGFKQGVLNSEKFTFKCYLCESMVSDS
jgi:hypothetical protein